MDTLTHTVLGVCTGQVIAGKKLGKKAMLIGALVNNLPDLDMLANFWHSPAEALLSHRGITHSILFAVLICPFLIWFFRKVNPSSNLTWKEWFYLIGHGLVLHIVLDACTTYGTGWFEPFNHYRVSFNTLFILDPFFMLPLLISAITLLILNKNKPSRSRIASIALVLSGFYLASTIAIKFSVNQHVKSELERQGIAHVDYAESPTPLNNLLWYVLVKQGHGYQAGYYSILDQFPAIHFEAIEQRDSLLSPYLHLSDVQCLLRFSKGYYQISKRPDSNLVFSDIRFGQIGVDELSKAPFVFNFELVKSANDTIVRQAPFKNNSGKDIQRLYERVKGN
jgi:inner membrane protein